MGAFPEGNDAIEDVPGAASGRSAPTRLRRHDRVWLAASWQRHSHRAPDDVRLAQWIAAGRALVVCRRDAALPEGAVALGLALPIEQGRARIAVVADRRAVVRSAPPMALGEAIGHAPPARRLALDELATRGAALGTTFAVYGSYAWQAITGADCVRAQSDIDLLWDARDAGHVADVIALLSSWERAHRLRADGEVRFADGAAVAWRELASGAARVLVKRDDGVALEASPLLR